MTKGRIRELRADVGKPLSDDELSELLDLAERERWVKTSERVPEEREGRGDLPRVLGWSAGDYEVTGVPLAKWREDPNDWPDYWMPLPPPPEEPGR